MPYACQAADDITTGIPGEDKSRSRDGLSNAESFVTTTSLGSPGIVGTAPRDSSCQNTWQVRHPLDRKARRVGARPSMAIFTAPPDGVVPATSNAGVISARGGGRWARL